MRTKKFSPAMTSTINVNPTQLKSAPEHERRVADVDIDQTITASQAEARFSMDAQRRKIASRIIIEAVSTGALEMMCKTIVTEVHARPLKPKPPKAVERFPADLSRGGFPRAC